VEEEDVKQSDDEDFDDTTASEDGSQVDRESGAKRKAAKQPASAEGIPLQAM
jgi:hypothetical protein